MAQADDVTAGSTGTFAGGALMVMRLTGDRQHLDLSADPRLADRVVDNGSIYPPPFGTPANTAGYKFDGRERLNRCSSARVSESRPTFAWVRTVVFTQSPSRTALSQDLCGAAGRSGKSPVKGVETMRSFARTLSAIALAGAISLPAAGAEYLANGNFEAGLTGWSKADAAGGDGTFSVQSGTTSP
ncbi:MAG: hypothetical protein IPI73_19405, partial [Betaproteobacteria bacterium]|nr:hypothetical protein [Betaproteobacteria bacterium]